MKKVYGTVVENMIIEDAVAEGMCVGKFEGKIVFVPFAAPGDIADVMLVRSKRRYSEGFIRSIHTPGPDRIDPFCEHYGTCGGCKWQHLSYEVQCKTKTKIIADNLRKIGGIDNITINPILASKSTTQYRNKLEFTFSDKRWFLDNEKENPNKELRGLGFHLPSRFDKILHINKCHLQKDFSNEIRNTIFKKAIELNTSFYDRREQKGFLRNLMIRNSYDDKWMATMVFGEDNIEKIEFFMSELKKALPKVDSWIYIINTKRNDSMDGLTYKVFSGKPSLNEKMEHLSFNVGPLSFFQTNREQAYELYKVVRNFAALTGEEIVYDLYSGTGTIGLFVAPKAKKIIGVEYVDGAVVNANENAKENNIENATFYSGDLAKILNEDFVATNGKPNVIITDPPRSGMHPNVVNQILKISPQKIVYVSCDSATQARDIALLKEKYDISAVQPVDMFPHTHHVENVILMTLK